MAQDRCTGPKFRSGIAVYTFFSFFFSSRRRHTRCGRDWSSDVCSSDLDDKLSIELFNGCCGPNGSAYWAVYHSREEANVDLRPELIVSYVIPAQAANVQLTGPGSTTAGAGTVKLADVPPSVLLRSQFGAQATPVNETPVNETPVNELPVNELPINETPVNELGFDDLAASVPALGDITLASIPLLRTGGWIAALSGTPLAALRCR